MGTVVECGDGVGGLRVCCFPLSISECRYSETNSDSMEIIVCFSTPNFQVYNHKAGGTIHNAHTCTSLY